jgi:hypothetical protein
MNGSSWVAAPIRSDWFLARANDMSPSPPFGDKHGEP